MNKKLLIVLSLLVMTSILIERLCCTSAAGACPTSSACSNGSSCTRRSRTRTVHLEGLVLGRTGSSWNEGFHGKCRADLHG